MIQDFLAESGSLILYFGDDRSDEYAFEALPNAITVKVGNPQDSAARYWVENPEKVGEFLQWLADAAPSGRPSLEGISR